jgi:hypothetical protein
VRDEEERHEEPISYGRETEGIDVGARAEDAEPTDDRHGEADHPNQT